MEPEYLLVTGTRTFDDYDLLAWKLDRVTIRWPDVVVCHGCARGADALAEKWAEANWYDREHFWADWDKYGKGAGFIRNKRMCEFVAGKGGLLVAFWDGKSRGTADCVEQFRRLCPTSRVVIQLY